MSTLTTRERELVALGAALGSNCIPCIEYHVPEARKAGLDDEQIRAALEVADKVRQVPARKALAAAHALIGAPAAETAADGSCAQAMAGGSRSGCR